jgi:predicted nucleic acid-binding Zn ribbon protein
MGIYFIGILKKCLKCDNRKTLVYTLVSDVFIMYLLTTHKMKKKIVLANMVNQGTGTQ